MKSLPLLELAQGGKPRPRKAPTVRPLESRLQCDVAALLRAHCLSSWRWWHIPNGGLRDIKTAVQLKRAGVVPGIPDLALISPDGRAHYRLLCGWGRGGHLRRPPDYLARMTSIWNIGEFR